MRILIDVNHPAHVHLFRYAAHKWEQRGHKVFWTARDKDLVISLLKHYGFEFEVLSSYRRGASRMAFEMIVRDWKLLKFAQKVCPDVMLGTSVTITHVSKFISAKSIFFTESDPQLTRLIAFLAFPFADTIVMPDILPDIWASKQVKHPSYHELAFLHPNHFTPDPIILDELGVAPGEVFFILRFIAWGASHDMGEKGLDLGAKRRLLRELLPYGRVFITSEDQLQSEFEQYRIHIQPHRIHDALYYATMFIGDSQSMPAEAAILGTPAFRCNSMVGRTTCVDELEAKYKLAYGFKPQYIDEMFSQIKRLLRDLDSLSQKWKIAKYRFLSEKVDFTEWMVNFVESYPRTIQQYRNLSYKC